MKKITRFIVVGALCLMVLPGFAVAELRPLDKQEALDAIQDKTFQGHDSSEYARTNYQIYYAADGNLTIYYATSPYSSVTVHGTWSIDDKGTYCILRTIHRYKHKQCGKLYQGDDGTLYRYDSEGKPQVTLKLIGSGNQLEQEGQGGY